MLNVVLITLDAVRYDLILENLESLPNLKALRDRSVSFENAFSVGPSTFFAFPPIIAGVYPYHFGMGIDRNIKPIDQVLHEHGYRTAQIVEGNILLTPHFGYGTRTDYRKYVLNLPDGDEPGSIESVLLGKGEPQGARRRAPRPVPLFGAVVRLGRVWRRHGWLRKLGRLCLSTVEFIRLYLLSGSASLDIHRGLYDRFRREVLEFIDHSFEAPQFLWVHTVINHLPYLPRENDSEFGRRMVNYLNCRGLAGLVTRGVSGKLKRLYMESLQVTDDFVGDIINRLEARGLLDDSLVILTADHGEDLLEEGIFGHDPESSSDRLLHVPLMFCSPRLFEPHSVSLPVSTIDILPTACDVLGISVPDTARGMSLRGTLIQAGAGAEDNQHLRTRAIFSEGWQLHGVLDRSPGWNSEFIVLTVRSGNHKLKLTRERTNANSQVERIDLIDWVTREKLDPQQNQQLVEHLRYLLEKHIADEGAFAASLQREAERGRLRSALGKKVKGREANRQPVVRSSEGHRAVRPEPVKRDTMDSAVNYLVSGLERSGTSLMMQMLQQGGLPLAFDDSRPPDEHNPRGYYELEGGKIINRLTDGSFDLESYRGRVVKVTAYGLKFIPKGRYKIIYMTRDIDEVLKSMRKMGADVEGERDRALFSKLNSYSRELMRSRADVEYVEINYRDLIDHPSREMERVSHFLHEPLDIEAAVKAVDSSLYRNRSLG